MIGASRIGPDDRVRDLDLDLDDDRDIGSPTLLRSLEVLVRLRVGNENTFVVIFRSGAP